MTNVVALPRANRCVVCGGPVDSPHDMTCAGCEPMLREVEREHQRALNRWAVRLRDEVTGPIAEAFGITHGEATHVIYLIDKLMTSDNPEWYAARATHRVSFRLANVITALCEVMRERPELYEMIAQRRMADEREARKAGSAS